jgi:hypothetical protein
MIEALLAVKWDLELSSIRLYTPCILLICVECLDSNRDTTGHMHGTHPVVAFKRLLPMSSTSLTLNSLQTANILRPVSLCTRLHCCNNIIRVILIVDSQNNNTPNTLASQVTPFDVLLRRFTCLVTTNSEVEQHLQLRPRLQLTLLNTLMDVLK